MQDRPANTISPSRFPFPVFPLMIKFSTGRCVEPRTPHPYLYRDSVYCTVRPNRTWTGRPYVQGDSTRNPFLGREAVMDGGLGKRQGNSRPLPAVR